MPFEMDEYYRGQLFAVSETSKNETGGGDGVQVLLLWSVVDRTYKHLPYTEAIDKVRSIEKDKEKTEVAKQPD